MFKGPTGLCVIVETSNVFWTLKISCNLNKLDNFFPFTGRLWRYLECGGVFCGICLLHLSGKRRPHPNHNWNPVRWNSSHAVDRFHSAICTCSTRLWRNTKPSPCGRLSSSATSTCLAWGTCGSWCSTSQSPLSPPSSPSLGSFRTEAATAECEQRKTWLPAGRTEI